MNNKKLVRNYIYNTLYQILVLLAPLVTTPYVSRVLGVTGIGIYNYSQSIAKYFMLIGAVGTSLYGQREIACYQTDPQKRTKAFWEIEAFRMSAVGACILVYFFLFCQGREYSFMFRVLLIEVAAVAFDISWLYMGLEDFRVTVIRNTIIKLVGIAAVLIFVKSPDDLNLYAVCVTLPSLLGNMSLWLVLKRCLVKVQISASELLRGIRKRLRPILVLFLPQVAMDIYLVLDKTMIGVLSPNIDQVGYYSQAEKIVKLVLTIATSLGTVMMPAMTAAFVRGDNEVIERSIKTAFRFVYMISFSLLFGLCAIAPRFVPLFFGRGYDPVVPLMMVISPILVIIATSNVIGRQFLLPTFQQREFTISIIAGAGTNFVLNALLIPHWGAMGASIATVIAELAVTVVQCVFVRKQLPLKKCLSPIARYGLFGLIMFCTVRGVGRILPAGRILSVIIMIVVGVVVYSTELLVTKDEMIWKGKDLLMQGHLK